jgi:hypothetical protein
MISRQKEILDEILNPAGEDVDTFVAKNVTKIGPKKHLTIALNEVTFMFAKSKTLIIIIVNIARQTEF